jgi:hypothetical protein
MAKPAVRWDVVRLYNPVRLATRRTAKRRLRLQQA